MQSPRTLESIKSRPIISIKNLYVRRKGKEIVKDVSWKIQKNEIWGLLGLNGSGKTTILDCITGYVPFYSGNVCVDGHEFGRYDWRELRKVVGLVSSGLNYKISSNITVSQMVFSGYDAKINCYSKATKAQSEKVNKLLQWVKCFHLKNRIWMTLSQGEKQRVLIARALMADYKILILDEPCVGLDPIVKESFIKLLNTIAKRKKAPAIVYVTHQIKEIFPSIKKILILKGGTIFAIGEKEDLLNSKTLSQAYSHTVKVIKKNDNYILKVL